MAGESEDVHSIKARYIAEVQYLYRLAVAENSQSQMALSAFEALVMIGGYWRFSSPQRKADPDWEPQAEALVAVPWWIVDNLAQAWVAYLDAPPAKTFGETLGIEGGGQGKRRAKEARMKMNRDLRLTMEVHKRRVEAKEGGQKLSLEKAYGSVAESTDTSKDIVRSAWRQHGHKLSKP